MHLSPKVIAIVAAASVPAMGVLWTAAQTIDTVTRLERDVANLSERVLEYERQQGRDEAVNERVKLLEGKVEYLELHHHDEHGGLGHVD